MPRPCCANATKATSELTPSSMLKPGRRKTVRPTPQKTYYPLLKAKPKTQAKPIPPSPPSPSTPYTHDLSDLWNTAHDAGFLQDAFVACWAAGVRARDAWLQEQIEDRESWIQCNEWRSARDNNAFENWSIEDDDWREESDQESDQERGQESDQESDQERVIKRE